MPIKHCLGWSLEIYLLSTVYDWVCKYTYEALSQMAFFGEIRGTTFLEFKSTYQAQSRIDFFRQAQGDDPFRVKIYLLNSTLDGIRKYTY